MDDLTLIIQYLLVGLGFINVGIAGSVAIRFALITHYKDRPGLLPWHVWIIGLSYSILTILAATSRMSNLGDPLYRWSDYAAGVLTGTAALLIITWHQWRWRLGSRKE